MSAFVTATTPIKTGMPSVYAGQIPDGWQQGRGAFGGLVLGLLAQAAEAELADPNWPLRSFSGEIMAPVLAESVELKVEMLRKGSGMATLEVRLIQGGELRSRATAIFGKARVTDRELNLLKPPAVPAYPSIEAAPIGPPMGPDFAPHLEYKPIAPWPFSGGTVPEVNGWVKFREATDGPLRMADLIGLADSYYPATYVIETMPRPMATVGFTFEPLIDPATLDPKGNFKYRCTVPAAHDGFSVELREVWTEDDRLVALNQQTFITIR